MNNIYYLRTRNYKYINYNDKFEEFYDIINDPDELLNIINEKSKIVNNFRDEMKLILLKIKNPENLKKINTKNEKYSIIRWTRNIGNFKLSLL